MKVSVVLVSCLCSFVSRVCFLFFFSLSLSLCPSFVCEALANLSFLVAANDVGLLPW